MDPEDLREVISAYQKCVAETLRRRLDQTFETTWAARNGDRWTFFESRLPTGSK
jgi:hypothetical protein